MLSEREEGVEETHEEGGRHGCLEIAGHVRETALSRDVRLGEERSLRTLRSL